MVQRCIASSAERGAARLTAERLDPLSMPMLAIPDERMPVCLGDPEVQTLLIGTGEPLGIDAFGGASPAFDLAPGAYWSRYWSCTQRGSGGMSTDEAIVGSARLEQTMQCRVHRGLCSGLDKTRMGPAKDTQQR
jgi:hypothetical protein